MTLLLKKLTPNHSIFRLQNQKTTRNRGPRAEARKQLESLCSRQITHIKNRNQDSKYNESNNDPHKNKHYGFKKAGEPRDSIFYLKVVSVGDLSEHTFQFP